MDHSNIKTEKINRVLIAGTGSGCGKTTVTIALLSALKKRGLDIAAAKCGPDYIDPMFHRSVIGAPSANLDSFFFDDNTLRAILSEHGAGRDITVIEGVMGYYDGLGLTSTKASAHEIADITESPVILVVNSKGASLSILAQISGFLNFTENSRIKGVILNNCSEKVYSALKPEIESRLAVRALGFLPRLEGAEIGSRHLGLITADEVENLREKLAVLAQQAEKSIDLDAVLGLAESAELISHSSFAVKKRETVCIAAARDIAFCFYYENSLSLLSKMGAQLIPFSPMNDERLPEDIHGLYLGGGYPELHTEALMKNASMRASIREAVCGGLPTIAECGGFMYLTRSIAGFDAVGTIDTECFDNGKLTRFGYVRLTANSDNMLCKAGDGIAAHEFHRWDSSDCGSGFIAEKTDGRKWSCVHTSKTLYAGFPHFHFYANRTFADNFYCACLKKKHGDNKGGAME